MVDEALVGLSSRFDTLYAKTGRSSIASEKLVRALFVFRMVVTAQNLPRMRKLIPPTA